jgi:hypothetical protein
MYIIMWTVFFLGVGGGFPTVRIGTTRWTQWHIPIILAVGRLGQKDPEFKTSLGYTESLMPAEAT